METIAVPHLRIVREPQPVSSYLRPAARDFSEVARILAAGHDVGRGIVIDGRALPRSDELRKAAAAAGVDVVLDCLGAEMTSPFGFPGPSAVRPPWAPRRRQSSAPWSQDEMIVLCRGIAEAASAAGVRAVLAPTSHLVNHPREAFASDLELVRRLRVALDDVGSQEIRIIYPLVTRLPIFRAETLRRDLVTGIQGLVQAKAIDAVWLRLSGFDLESSGPAQIRQYIEVARGFHILGIPIVGDRVCSVGIAFMAVGAVSAISSGIATGERFDAASILKRRAGTGFANPRVYFPEIGVSLPRSRAELLLRSGSVKNWLTCQRPCCEKGATDMLGEARRHFVVSRAQQVAQISRIPNELRGEYVLESWLRPASDLATRVAKVDARLQRHRQRLDDWRVTVATIVEEDKRRLPTMSPALAPESFRRGA